MPSLLATVPRLCTLVSVVSVSLCLLGKVLVLQGEAGVEKGCSTHPLLVPLAAASTEQQVADFSLEGQGENHCGTKQLPRKAHSSPHFPRWAAGMPKGTTEVFVFFFQGALRWPVSSTIANHWSPLAARDETKQEPLCSFFGFLSLHQQSLMMSLVHPILPSSAMSYQKYLQLSRCKFAVFLVCV